MTEEELLPYIEPEKKEEKYSIDSYNINDYTKILFETLDRRIRNLSTAVKREFKKLYVAYKLDTNFVDIVFQEKRLRISVNMKFTDIIDKYNVCRDVSNIGRWGNGDVEFFFEDITEVEKAMDIIEQSFNAHMDM